MNMLDHIVETVASFYGLRRDVLLGPRRDVQIVRPRQLVMMFAREFTSLSLVEIGRRLPGEGHANGRDHTTVMHAVNAMQTRQEGDAGLTFAVQSLRAELTVFAEVQRRRRAAGRRVLVRTDRSYAFAKVQKRVGRVRAEQLFLARSAKGRQHVVSRRWRDIPQTPKSVVAYIDTYIAKRGYGPTQHEISRALGVPRSTVQDSIINLSCWGWLHTGTRYQHRALTTRLEEAA